MATSGKSACLLTGSFSRISPIYENWIRRSSFPENVHGNDHVGHYYKVTSPVLVGLRHVRQVFGTLKWKCCAAFLACTVNDCRERRALGIRLATKNKSPFLGRGTFKVVIAIQRHDSPSQWSNRRYLTHTWTFIYALG